MMLSEDLRSKLIIELLFKVHHKELFMNTHQLKRKELTELIESKEEEFYQKVPTNILLWDKKQWEGELHGDHLMKPRDNTSMSNNNIHSEEIIT